MRGERNRREEIRGPEIGVDGAKRMTYSTSQLNETFFLK